MVLSEVQGAVEMDVSVSVSVSVVAEPGSVEIEVSVTWYVVSTLMMRGLMRRTHSLTGLGNNAGDGRTSH